MGSEPAVKASGLLPEYERPETAGNMGVVSKTNYSSASQIRNTNQEINTKMKEFNAST